MVLSDFPQGLFRSSSRPPITNSVSFNPASRAVPIGFRLAIIGEIKSACNSLSVALGHRAHLQASNNAPLELLKPPLPVIPTTNDEPEKMEDDLGKVAQAILNNSDAVDPSVIAGQYGK